MSNSVISMGAGGPNPGTNPVPMCILSIASECQGIVPICQRNMSTDVE